MYILSQSGTKEPFSILLSPEFYDVRWRESNRTQVPPRQSSMGLGFKYTNKFKAHKADGSKTNVNSNREKIIYTKIEKGIKHH